MEGSCVNYYEYNGSLYTIDELSLKFNIKKRTLYSRLCEKKWSVDKAIKTPVKKQGDESVAVGVKYNHLRVIRPHGRSKQGRTTVECICDCGNKCIKEYTFVKNNKIKTCGKCNLALIESVHNRKDYHGKQHTRVYQSWRGMLLRCYNKNSCKYKNYGGRGITVCDEWKNNFKAFYDWSMANGYQDDLTIDRIDVNGNYTPENCRWADSETQAYNKTNTIKVPYNGKLYTVCELSKLFNIARETIHGKYYNGTLIKWLNKNGGC